MSSTTTSTTSTTSTKLELSEEVADHSRAEIREVLRSTDDREAMASTSFSISTHADPDDQQVWLSIRLHSYASLEWTSPTLSRGVDLLTQHLSRQEAEALVAVLTHELGKFQD